MLKLKIKKELYDALPDEVKKLYKENGDEFNLDVEGVEDTGALKRAKDREVVEKKEALGKLKAAEDKLAEFNNNNARKEGDIETLEKAWQKKHEEQKGQFDTELSKKDNYIQKMLVDNQASEIASKISTSPSLIMPHIKARLSADLTGENPLTKVLDAEGKVSAMTLEELSKEFVDNKEFAPIIVGNKASGSGASGTKTVTTPSSAVGEPKKLSELSPKELAAHITSNNTEE